MGGDENRAHTVARLTAARRQPAVVHESGLPDRGEGEDRTPDGAAATPDWLLPDSHRPGSLLSSVLPQRWRSARVDPGRHGAIALAVAGVFVVLLAAGAVFRDSPTAAPAPPLAVVTADTADPLVTSAPDAAVEMELVVSVVGLVSNPGLVRLQPGSRLADALAAAGGPVEGADLLALNMAARVADGDQIVIGLVPPEAGPPVSSTTSAQSLTTDTGAASADTAAGSTDVGAVDLNAATVPELDALPGVGPVTATSIVRWREINGRFATVDQLAEVDGIGPGRLAKIRDLVYVG